MPKRDSYSCPSSADLLFTGTDAVWENSTIGYSNVRIKRSYGCQGQVFYIKNGQVAKMELDWVIHQLERLS